MARPDRVRHSFPATAERDFAYLHFMRPKRPGRACFACLCQHSRQAETAAIGRTARRSVPTSNSTNQDAQGAKRTHKIRYVNVPTGFGRAGRALRHGAPACASHLSACGYAQEDADMAPSRVSGVARQSEDGTEHQRGRLSIGNQQLAAKRKNECKKPSNPNC